MTDQSHCGWRHIRAFEWEREDKKRIASQVQIPPSQPAQLAWQVRRQGRPFAGAAFAVLVQAELVRWYSCHR